MCKFIFVQVVLSDDDEQLLPLKNVKRKKTENPSPRKGKSVKVEPAPAPRRTAAFLTEESFEPLNCWWEEKEKKKDGIQWSYLEHNGLMFTPAYVPHRVPVFIDGESYVLPPPAEEVANYWCAALESDYRDKSKFVGNFWAALINRLPPNHVIRENKLTLEDVDFSSIKSRLDSNREILREQRKNLTKEDRELERLKKDKEEGPYTYALVDWLREKVGTFKTEPPSLFRGRGEHPKMGMLKRRIFPEEVSLNIHEDAPVPRLPTEMIGHAWKDVYHDNTVSWLTYYRDSVNGQFKYTFLGAGSAVKGQKDHYKYEKARKLKNHIENIRKDYLTKMECDDPVDKQLGTATYMLDRLALRVGNEKDASEEADTVGCCSLRVEHLSIDKENDTITLDFLGKDSIRYLNTTKVIPIVCKNLASFIKGKKPDKEIFESISTGSLNKYLRDLMPELTAKVFRTFNASFTLQNELDKLDPTLVDLSNPETTKQFYDLANREVAILCNHQRSVPKQHESSMDKMMLQLQRYEEDIEEIKQYLAWYKGKQTHPFRFKPLQRQDGGGGGAGRVSVVKDGMKADVAQRKLILLEKRKGNHDIRMKMKDANKTVSNTTSKQHYMDPRITVSFCKKWELPIEKLFNTTLRRKFPWAMYARNDFVF